jgi:hypothetical protein
MDLLPQNQGRQYDLMLLYSYRITLLADQVRSQILNCFSRKIHRDFFQSSFDYSFHRHARWYRHQTIKKSLSFNNDGESGPRPMDLLIRVFILFIPQKVSVEIYFPSKDPFRSKSMYHKQYTQTARYIFLGLNLKIDKNPFLTWWVYLYDRILLGIFRSIGKNRNLFFAICGGSCRRMF